MPRTGSLFYAKRLVHGQSVALPGVHEPVKLAAFAAVFDKSDVHADSASVRFVGLHKQSYDKHLLYLPEHDVWSRAEEIYPDEPRIRRDIQPLDTGSVADSHLVLRPEQVREIANHAKKHGRQAVIVVHLNRRYSKAELTTHIQHVIITAVKGLAHEHFDEIGRNWRHEFVEAGAEPNTSRLMHTVLVLKHGMPRKADD